MDIDDLALSRHTAARSVVLLAPEGSEDPDSEVIKTLAVAKLVVERHDLGAATYGDALLAFEKASVIGLIEDGVPTLNPPELPTHGVLIGWNERAPIILRELDHYAPAGSTLSVVTSFGTPESLTVTVVAASTTDRATLEAHVVAELDQVIVLCYSDHLEVQAADARTLVTLLHVRDILGRLGSPRGETAIGYRSDALAGDHVAGFGVVVNPAKSRTFAVQDGDRVVVLAES
ncbi:hypothetical protein LRP67_08805 [Nocardioides sp. cx-169]|uniref:hypothetical protein n=1 Tax=Nocardioides sp. cx-169 TaxID=2899080 RepID=UPI001E376843|nr:hypothetical protein [Nocardioides sp. cx-169]MCD4534178.1 hypothetical protein [Nocardioides sp. cx-169]